MSALLAHPVWLTLVVTLLVMVALWVLSVRLRNASIVDAWWGPGFALIAVVGQLAAGGYETRKLLVTVLTLMWGLRLGAHILSRNMGHGEDFRYAAMRASAPDTFWWRSLFTVFGLQGLLMWMISMPLQAAQAEPLPDRLVWLDFLGIAVWAGGLFFESVGDWQLTRFKADPKNRGKVLDRGLWRYTRHPNYFGDAVVWWGFYLVAAATPTGRLTFLAPLVMTWLLLRVSGVGLLEKTLSQRPQYRDYIERTSAFLPWPPKRPKGDR